MLEENIYEQEAYSISIYKNGNQLLAIDTTQSQIKLITFKQEQIQWKLCDSLCLQCEKKDYCTQCYENKNRVLNNDNKCVCKDGYFLNNQNECEICKYNCKTCSNSKSCDSCDIAKHREKGNQMEGDSIVMDGNKEVYDCHCQNDFFDNKHDALCQKDKECDEYCIGCFDGECKGCRIDFIKTVNNQCVCPFDTYLKPYTQYQTDIIDDKTSQSKKNGYYCKPICKADCKTCIKGTNKCIECNDGFYYFEGTCIQKCPENYIQNEQGGVCDKFFIQGCKKYSETFQCEFCEDDYLITEDKKQCRFICPKNFIEFNDVNKKACIEKPSIKICSIQDCQQCSQTLLFCEKCSDDFFFFKDQTQCLKNCPNNFKGEVINGIKKCIEIIIPIDKNIYFEIKLEIANQVELNFQSTQQFDINQIKDNLIFSIPDLIDRYTDNIEIVSSNQILIKIQAKKLINEKLTAKIKFQNSEILHIDSKEKVFIVLLKHEEIKIEQKDQQIGLSVSEQKVSQVLDKAANTASNVAKISIIPLQITGKFQYIASLIDICQIIYIMYFAEVKYFNQQKCLNKYSILFIFLIRIPENVKNFYEGLEEFKIPFYNFFEQLQENHNIKYGSPIKFEEQNIQGFFLSNFGDNMSYAISIITVHLIIKFVIRKIFKSNKETISKFSRSILNPKFYLDLLWGLYIELAVAVLLQVRVMKKAEYIEEGINYTCFSIGLLVLFAPVVLCLFMIFKKFEWITNPLKENMNSNYYTLFLYARKIYIAFVLIFMLGSPLTQIILISAWHTITLFYILKYKPYKEKNLQIRHIVQTIFFLISTLLLIYFFENDPDIDEQSINYGWVVISSFAVIILIDFVIFIQETTQQLIRIFKSFVEKIRNFKNKKSTKKQQSLEQSISECDGDVSSKSQKGKQYPSVKINGRSALPVKVIDVNPFPNVSNRQNISDVCSFEMSPLDYADQKQFNFGGSTRDLIQFQSNSTIKKDISDETTEIPKHPSSRKISDNISINLQSENQLKINQNSFHDQPKESIKNKNKNKNKYKSRVIPFSNQESKHQD